MKKYFLTLLFSCLTISVMAETPRLSRNDLGLVTMIENPVLDASSMTDANSSPSLSRFMRELSDNRLTNKSSLRLSLEELEGVRIASFYAFNFDWDYDNQVAIVNDSSYAMKGQCCEITLSSSTNNELYLSNFYENTRIPIKINLNYGFVTIKAGVPLDTITDTVTVVVNPIRNNGYNSQNVHAIRTRTIYAMPLSWLTGDDFYFEIHGQVEEDGSITLENFAFLVREEVQGIESWELSPIFKYITFFRPNGSHSFTFSEPYVDQWGLGYGGLVPRKPGTSKPVSPRPFTPINTLIGNSNSNFDGRLIKNRTMTKLDIKDFVQWNSDEPFGHGGLVPRKPGSSRPVSCPPFDSVIASGRPSNEFNSVIGTGNGGFNPDSLNPGSIDPEYVLTYMKVPVYVKTINDSTFIVYNLFGLGNACVIKTLLDGTMDLPRQEAYNNGLGEVYYNDWNTGYCTGSWKKTVSWSQTSLYDMDENGQYHELDRTFKNNSLIFSDSVPPQPGITDYVMATKVRFTVFTHTPSLAFLYRYDLETGDSCMVNNPVTFPREDKPYKVRLAAKTYDLDTYMYSEMVYLEYEIPALDGAFIRGDVNGDGAVNISDVTAMIDGLLTDNWDGKNYDNADCNEDGSVNISDVTSLIDFLLSDTWAE